MANVLIPFLVSMLLGRTIDLTTYTIGGDIYDPADFIETPIREANSLYTVLQDNVLPYSYIGLPADLVLRIKSNFLGSSSGALGLEGLLKDTSWKSNSVVVAVTSMVQTVHRTLRDDAPLLPNWTTRIHDNQTHYAHAMTYGGWSAVLYRFVCHVPGDEDIVRNTLNSMMGMTGVMDEDAIGRFQKAKAAIEQNQDLNGKVTLQVHSYSSVPHSEDVTSFENLLEAIEKFSGDVGQIGKPLFVELKPLNKLNSRYPVLKINHDLDHDLEQLDVMFDDLRDTKTSMRKWMTSTLAEFTDEEEEKISNLFDHIVICIQLFHKIAGEASIYKQMDPSYVRAAFRKYTKALTKESRTYEQLFKRLKEDLDPECEDDFVHRIRGALDVAHNELLEMGEVRGGLEGCKALCIAERKCRAVGYAENTPVLVPTQHVTQSPVPAHYQLRLKSLCRIYFRSTNTAKLISANSERASSNRVLYDRKCH